MAMPPDLHRALDRLAMWLEDRIRRAPSPYRPGPAGPLDAFGPLPPPPPDGAVLRTPARGPRRGTAILAPPWKLPTPRLLRGWTSLLAREGLETWLLVPPHHLWRTAPGSRSGEGFVAPDLGVLRRSLEQTVRELRSLAALAASRGPVGLVGLSLGALAAAHAATAPEAVAFAALVAPPVDLARVLGASAIGARYRRLAERAGSPLPPEAELRSCLLPLSPASRAPTARRLLVAAGSHDAIVPPEGPESLARAWGTAARLFPRGHVTLLFACRALRREVAALARGAGESAPSPAR